MSRVAATTLKSSSPPRAVKVSVFVPAVSHACGTANVNVFCSWFST